MKKVLKYSPFYILVVYLIKSFIVIPSIFDFGVIFIMSYIALEIMRMDKSESTYREELIGIISQLEDKVNKNHDSIKKDHDNYRKENDTKFSTINLTMQRPVKKPDNGAFKWGS